MIGLLRGKLRSKQPFVLLLDVQGVGYEVHATQEAFERAPELGEEYEIFIRMIVREDSMTLFGFASADERHVFDTIITVSGIGPKTGLTILSAVGASRLRESIRSADIHTLVSVPGIGRKTGERLIVELRDKMLKDEWVSTTPTETVKTGDSQIRSDVLQALLSLGYQRANAEKAIRETIRDNPAETQTIEKLLRATLSRLTS